LFDKGVRNEVGGGQMMMEWNINRLRNPSIAAGIARNKKTQAGGAKE